MENQFNPLILNKIFSNLPLEDLKLCSLVDKRFNRAFNVDLLWKYLFKRDYNENITKYFDIFKTDCAKLTFKKYAMLAVLNRKLGLGMEICQLASVQKLDLSNKHLKEIPKEIGQLASLQSLNLNYNELTEIPKEIGLLALQKLDLAYRPTCFFTIFEFGG